MLNAIVNYNKIYFYNLILIALLLPFTEYIWRQFISIAIILLVVSWILLSDKKEVLRKIKSNKIIFLLIAVYFINVNGLFREIGDEVAGKVLIKKMSLLLFPIIIGTSPFLNYNRIRLILVAFISSLFVSTLFTYSEGVTYLLKLQDDITAVANVIIIHRPYYGLLGAFAVVALLLFFQKKQSGLIWLLLSLAIIYLCLFLAIIYAKMGLIAILVSLAFLVFCWFAFTQRFTLLIITSLFVLGAAITTYQLQPSVQNYTSKIIEGKDFSFSEYNVVLVGSINTRYVNWGCAYVILKENKNWLYGVGPGNAQNLLQSCYKVRNEWVYQSRMNAHNQFIEELLQNGIAGLVLFTGSLLIPFFIGLHRKDYLYLSFLMVFIMCCLTESVLGRQIGIVFYAFFNSLLLFNPKKEPGYNSING